MGQSSGKTQGKLQTSDTAASGKKFYSNFLCVGCGCSPDLMNPLFASECRCICVEHGTRIDPIQCQQASDLCLCRSGCKLGPVVGEVKNPIVDNVELIVVCDKKVADCGKNTTVNGQYQTGDTRISGKKYHTNCVLAGCGIVDDLCSPAIASETRVCCVESGTRVDCSDTKTASDICKCRGGCKLCPATVDVKNPIVDNHELIVVNGSTVYGCK